MKCCLGARSDRSGKLLLALCFSFDLDFELGVMDEVVRSSELE